LIYCETSTWRTILLVGQIGAPRTLVESSRHLINDAIAEIYHHA
jgi:hypothetical protein